jgi:CRISPR-associated endoribonuclease Cas6
MRLHLRLQSHNVQLSFDYQHELVRSFHRWLPDNDIHDDISLYSLSWLGGAKAHNGSLHFPQGATWFISFHDERIAKHLLVGMLRNPATTFGMRVGDVQIQEEPDFGAESRFILGSPVLAKHFDGTSILHKTYADQDVDDILTHTLQSKLRSVGLSDDVHVQFDRTYPNAKTKLVTIKNIKNRASMCPVIVKGAPEAVSFAWSVGIGHCTGVGFGAVHGA